MLTSLELKIKAKTFKHELTPSLCFSIPPSYSIIGERVISLHKQWALSNRGPLFLACYYSCCIVREAHIQRAMTMSVVCHNGRNGVHAIECGIVGSYYRNTYYILLVGTPVTRRLVIVMPFDHYVAAYAQPS